MLYVLAHMHMVMRNSEHKTNDYDGVVLCVAQVQKGLLEQLVSSKLRVESVMCNC